jgi:FkbM family methyltransferase
VKRFSKLKKSPQYSFNNILQKNFPEGSYFHFIQIGANDGVNYDDLFEMIKARKSCGLVVEPLPDYFEKLKSNYSFNPKIIPVNVAIHPTDKTVTIYRVNPKALDELPDWANGIASLDPNHHLKSKTPSEHIVSQSVKAITFTELMNDYYSFKHLDLIQIDVEGFDFEIIKLIDLEKYRPKIIKFEYVNLDKATKREAIQYLQKHNFYSFVEGGDIVSVDLNKVLLKS